PAASTRARTSCGNTSPTRRRCALPSASHAAAAHTPTSCGDAPVPGRAAPAHSCGARSGTSPCNTSCPSETASAPHGGRACTPGRYNAPFLSRLLVLFVLHQDFIPPGRPAVYVRLLQPGGGSGNG